MSVWRIDVIYPDAPGGPWISPQEFLTETKPAKPTWHRAADPVKLLRLVDSFKLLKGKFDGGPTLDDGYTIAEPTPTPVVEQTPPFTAIDRLLHRLALEHSRRHPRRRSRRHRDPPLPKTPLGPPRLNLRCRAQAFEHRPLTGQVHQGSFNQLRRALYAF